jgi:hypothetical protein
MHIIRISKISLCNHIDSDHFEPPFENHNRGTRIVFLEREIPHCGKTNDNCVVMDAQKTDKKLR